jgi:hypothetical protein
MTLLLAHVQPEAAIILTDTLAAQQADGIAAPVAFVTKCIAVPHMNLAVAAVGLSQALSAVAADLLGGRYIARDIDELHQHLPTGARATWASYGPMVDSYADQADLPELARHHTMLTFGRSIETGRVTGYLYSSRDDFAGQQIVGPEGMASFTHPKLRDGGDEFLLPVTDNLLGDWTALAAQIRAEQQAAPDGYGSFIGGDLCLTIVNADGSINQRTIGRFDDRDDQWQAIQRFWAERGGSND